jgi:hypothetical protein
MLVVKFMRTLRILSKLGVKFLEKPPFCRCLHLWLQGDTLTNGCYLYRVASAMGGFGFRILFFFCPKICLLS